MRNANRDRETFVELFQREEPFVFQTFDDKKRFHTLSKIISGKFWEIEHELDYMNSKGAVISLTINHSVGGRKIENITKVAAVWADLDGAAPDDALDRSPHLTVETSPGRYHCYWLVEDLPLEAFTQTQLSIAHTLSSDSAVSDLPRAMRMPGFYHQKKERFLSRIVQKNLAQNKFSWYQLIEMFPPQKKKLWSKFDDKKSFAKPDPNMVTLNTEKYRGQYGETAGNRNNSTIKIIGGMIRRGLDWDRIEEEVKNHCESCSPPVAEFEVRMLLKSGRKYYDRTHGGSF